MKKIISTFNILFVIIATFWECICIATIINMITGRDFYGVVILLVMGLGPLAVVLFVKKMIKRTDNISGFKEYKTENTPDNNITKLDENNKLGFNLKLSYSEDEECLATQFVTEHQNEIKEYEDKLYNAMGEAYEGEKEEQIYNCKEALKIWKQFRKWCYKTKAGTIYFQDTWEYCHNSKNKHFLYIDEVKEHLYNLENGINDYCNFFGVPVELADRFEKLIKNSENILQKDIYDILKTDKKQELSNYISYLETENKIIRIKRGNTYELKWNFDENINTDNEYDSDMNNNLPKLIHCPVCDKEVSNQAIACPNCGHPIASNTVGRRVENKTTNHEKPIDYSSIVDYSNPTTKPIKGNFRHINGLNIAENAQCEVLLYPSGYEFKSGAIKFNLPKSKVIDVTVKTDREIQQQYVSSIGGAVAGGVIFGPLGAIIGGRAKKKSIKTYSSYLIITYKDGENIKYIGFDVTNAPFKAKKFETEFKKTNNTITRVDL